MWHRRLARTLPVLAAVVLLAASPAFAAPSPDASASTRFIQILAEWWEELTRPLVGVFQASSYTGDSGGQPTATEGSDGPTANPQHGHGIDPDG